MPRRKGDKKRKRPAKYEDPHKKVNETIEKSEKLGRAINDLHDAVDRKLIQGFSNAHILDDEK